MTVGGVYEVLPYLEQFNGGDLRILGSSRSVVWPLNNGGGVPFFFSFQRSTSSLNSCWWCCACTLDWAPESRVNNTLAHSTRPGEGLESTWPYWVNRWWSLKFPWCSWYDVELIPTNLHLNFLYYLSAILVQIFIFYQIHQHPSNQLRVRATLHSPSDIAHCSRLWRPTTNCSYCKAGRVGVNYFTAGTDGEGAISRVITRVRSNTLFMIRPGKN